MTTQNLIVKQDRPCNCGMLASHSTDIFGNIQDKIYLTLIHSNVINGH